LLCLDGKTLRGTIPLGQSQGVHLLAAYLPQEGVVLGQVQVNGAGNEPTQAPALLSTLDLRGMIVSGDAIFARRDLSLKVIQAKGDYHGTRQRQSVRALSGYSNALYAANVAAWLVGPADRFPHGSDH